MSLFSGVCIADAFSLGQVFTLSNLKEVLNFNAV